MENCGNNEKLNISILTFGGLCFLGIIIVMITLCKSYKILKRNKGKPGQLVNDKEELQGKIEELQHELARRKEQYKHDWRSTRIYPDWRKEEFSVVNVTLDEDTAHPNLLLSKEKKQVTWQENSQDLTSSAQRFDSIPCVLGLQNLTKGRHYWEVEVGPTGSWDLGVCRNDVARNGKVIMTPQNGFWAIRFYDGEYWALTSPETHLTLRGKPLRVGIFVDYEAEEVIGEVSFYNLTDGSHIYTFTQDKFHGILRPLYRLWAFDSGILTTCSGETKQIEITSNMS